MWTSEIKPQCFLNLSKSKNSSLFYVVDIYLSSSVVERHIFSNSRKLDSFVNHCCKIMPHYNKHLSSLSYYNYRIFADELTDEFTFND